jgi:hypothetical protein
MFSNPPTVDQYLRIRYYVGTDAPGASRPGASWAATELVLPAHREDRIRRIQSYRDSYRDKALAIALDEFFGRRDPHLIQRETRPSQLPDSLAPVGRFFARQFQRQHLQSNERILRTEVWSGTSPNPRRGAPADSPEHAARVAALRGYYEGPVEHRLRVPPYPPYHGTEKEADIVWVLEYFEEP